MDPETIRTMRANFAAATALETISTPEDIAEAVAFLALDARTMTGQLMTVDGGALLGRSAVKVSR